MKKRNSSNDMGIFGKVVAGLSISLLLVFAIGFVFGLFFFGFAGFFRVFGVEYESTSSLLIYVVFFTGLGFIMDLFAKVFVILSKKYFPKRYQHITSRIVLETLFGWFALYIVDEIMHSMMVPITVEFVAALLLTLADYVFDEKKKSKNET